jgi:hypothetical protein
MKVDCPVRKLCATLDCSTSTAYYGPCSQDESHLVAAIEQVLLRFPILRLPQSPQGIAAHLGLEAGIEHQLNGVQLVLPYKAASARIR